MNDDHLEVTLDLEDDLALSGPEMKLLADLLPELLKDLIWLQADNEA